MHSTASSSATWWSRSWKWWVPVLAASMLVLLLALLIGLMALLLDAMKSSGPYQHAVARAQADPDVAAALGAPIEPGWFVQGNISINGPGGEADLAIPLQGARAGGTLYVTATRQAGQWRYETVAVNVDGGQRIALEDGRPPSSP